MNLKSEVNKLSERSSPLPPPVRDGVSKKVPDEVPTDSKAWALLRVPIRIEGWRSSLRQPLSVSLPLPQGRVFAPCQAGLSSSRNESKTTQCDTQTEALAYWSDGSVRWLLVHFCADNLKESDNQLEVLLTPAQHNELSSGGIRLGGPTGIKEIISDQLKIQLDEDSLIFSECGHGAAVSAKFVLTDIRSQQHEVRFEKGEIEYQGDVLNSIGLVGKVASRADEKQLLNCKVRLTSFSGLNRVKLQVTLHNPRRAAHHGGLWDLGDEGSVLFKSWQILLKLNSSSQESEPIVAWIAETADDPVASARAFEIYQDSSGGENWTSPVHVNRSGRVPCQFRGYRIMHDEQQTAGLRANPVAGVQTENDILSVGVQDFWQQFPLSIKAAAEGIQVGLFPSQWSDQFELQGGEQKTHSVWIEFAKPSDDQTIDLESLLPAFHMAVHQPAQAMCDTQWYVKSAAMPFLSSSLKSDEDPVCRKILNEAIEGKQSLFEKRETIDEYGWRNFGDVWADHEQAYYRGKGLVVSHYNNQFDMIEGGIRQLMQSGDRHWWSFVAPLVRHVLDIDLYRTEQDRAAYNGGLFWFTDHYYSAATATHRTFSRQNAPVQQTDSGTCDYGGGPGSEHNFSTGLLYYYWMTGDLDAAEGVRSLADWVLAMDDGSLNVWGVFDPGPTGLASMSGKLEYQGPGRGPANSIQVLLDGWLLFRDPKYLSKAEILIHRVIHPNDDIRGLQLLDAERRWSYTMFLAALIRYLEVKSDENQIDAAYAYAYESLLAYARWMAEHEVPYLDSVEKLEFPTEAWAAQDLRKANVMRIAATLLNSMDADEAARLFERGTQIANRSWRDLNRFETRNVTRSVAIVMNEGNIDGYLRSAHSNWKFPVPERTIDFGVPKKFVPQKIRLETCLKTPAGIVKLLLALFRPAAWRIMRHQLSKGI